MSNITVKENENLEGKSKNESGIQDKSQKCDTILINLLWVISI